MRWCKHSICTECVNTAHTVFTKIWREPFEFGRRHLRLRDLGGCYGSCGLKASRGTSRQAVSLDAVGSRATPAPRANLCGLPPAPSIRCGMPAHSTPRRWLARTVRRPSVCQRGDDIRRFDAPRRVGKKSHSVDRGGGGGKKTGTALDPDPGVPLCPGLRFGGINVS